MQIRYFAQHIDHHSDGQLRDGVGVHAGRVNDLDSITLCGVFINVVCANAELRHNLQLWGNSENLFGPVVQSDDRTVDFRCDGSNFIEAHVRQLTLVQNDLVTCIQKQLFRPLAQGFKV